MDQSQIDDLKKIRKDSTKKIKKKVSKIRAVDCDCSDIELSDDDVQAIEETRRFARAKKMKYANT